MLSHEMDRELSQLSDEVEDIGRAIHRASEVKELRILHRRLTMKGQVLENLIEIAKI